MGEARGRRFVGGLWLVAAVALVAAPGAARAATFCVSSTGELQTALTTAASNGQHDTIQIVQGTYGSVGMTLFSEAYNLTLEGGYGTGCSPRTVDPANTVLDGGNASQVMWLNANVKVDFTVDGLTIRNGKLTGGLMGAGLRAQTVSGGNVTLKNDVFSNNSTESKGGGAFIYGPNVDGGAVTVSGCTFTGNSANQGGGLYVGGFTGTIALTGNTFLTNQTAGENGGGLYVYNGGAVNASGNVWQGNTAASLGAMGGGAYVLCASGDWNGNRFSSNGAYYGGGLTLYSVVAGNTFQVSNNTFGGNTGSFQGGGMFVSWEGTIQMTGNLLYRNTSGQGAGVSIPTVRTLELKGNTITDNDASTAGGGLLLLLTNDADWAGLKDNIFWANTAPTGDDLWIDNDGNSNGVASPFVIQYTDFDQSADGTYLVLPISFSTTNYNKIDPLFVDPTHLTAPDYHLQSLVGSYHGGAWTVDPCHSPMIDAGDPGSSYDSEPDPNGGRMDLGNYGNTDQASKSRFPLPTPACNPAAVALLAFTATRAPGGVRLAWQTGAETKCGAFTILRCALATGGCAAVADHAEVPGLVVPCAGDPAGWVYEALDGTAAADAGYSYYLREHETTGGTFDYGPAFVGPAAADPPAASGAGGGAAASPGPAAGCALGAPTLAALPLGLLPALLAIRRRRRLGR